MKAQTIVQGVLAALGLGIVATATDAATITIEPDDYVGLIGNVAPGAQLSAFRAAVPGGCDYAVHLDVTRRGGDISYIEFGGGYATSTYSLVDKLQYRIP